MIVRTKAQKMAYVVFICRSWEGSDSQCFHGVWANSVTVDDMAEKLELLIGEVAFFGL